MRRRRGRKGLEMDDVTGNFGCVLWFGIRVSSLSIRPYLYWSSCHFQIMKKVENNYKTNFLFTLKTAAPDLGCVEGSQASSSCCLGLKRI